MTVALLDALVLARSGFHHSADYRSVMVFGEAREVTDEAEKLGALEAFIEHVFPGLLAGAAGRPPAGAQATAVLWVELSEASAKVRDGGPHDDAGDEGWPTWACIVWLPDGGGPFRAGRARAAGDGASGLNAALGFAEGDDA